MKDLARRKRRIERPSKTIFLDIYIKYKSPHKKFLGVTIFMLGLLAIIIINKQLRANAIICFPSLLSALLGCVCLPSTTFMILL